MTAKKESKDQLERRIKNAIVLVPKDKDTQSIWFDDKGVRITITSDCAVISTGYHQHVFSAWTGSGASRPYLYSKRFVEVANTTDCITRDEKGEPTHSYAKLFDELKKKEDKADYNVAVYFDWWLFNIFQPLYSIDETNAGSFLVYEAYLHNIARNAIVLSEKTEDITNKTFIEKVSENLKEYSKEIKEVVVFPKKSDEEVMRENIDAIQEQETEKLINEQENESKV